MVAQLLSGAKRAWEQALHPWRRRRAWERVAAHSRPPQILVICHGNICRSPFAAGLLEHALGSAGVRVASAGLWGPGRPSPAAAIKAGLRRGVDLQLHRSQLVTPALAASADLILVMDARQRAVLRFEYGVPDGRIVVLGDLDPVPIPGRAILDPYDRPAADYERSYARIERCVAALLALLTPSAGLRRRQSAAARA